MLKRSMATAVAVISLAAVSFGQYSFKGNWVSGGEYKGSYQVGQGDTVKHKKWGEEDLVWWAKFVPTANDEPGNIVADGTSAWVLVNSFSASKSDRGTPTNSWKGWTGTAPAMNSPLVPTWRNGAKGAYSMTHDDIGSMPFNESVQPGWDVAKQFPDIKPSWGVSVEAMNEQGTWEQARQMVMDGHEMFNHSMTHTSAADRWFVMNPDTRVNPTDPDLPEKIRGFEIVGAWTIQMHYAKATIVDGKSRVLGWNPAVDQKQFGNSTFADANGDWEGPLPNEACPDCDEGTYVDTLKISNDLVDIYVIPYWEGMSPSDVGGPNGNGVIKTVPKKESVKPYTIEETGQVVYIDEEAEQISVNAVGWLDLQPIRDTYSFYENHTKAPEPYNPAENPRGKECYDNGLNYTECDKGRPAMVLKLHTANGWTNEQRRIEMVEANDIINANIYSKIGANPHFKTGKKSEYFGYPFDVYSEDTHQFLADNDYVGGRGGSKSGVPMPNDFFHPYRIDFDAFFIEDPNFTVGGNFINQHVLLGVNQMVDEIIARNGYMVREFHAVANLWNNDGSWCEGDDPEDWAVNNEDKGQGGYWGGIAAFQLRAHYEYIQSKIDSKELVVYTPSEAVKYRVTANAVTGATMSRDGNKYNLTVTANSIEERYRDEISVIVSFEDACTEMAIEYGDGEGYDKAPYRRPVKMDNDGKVWSVNVNPFRSGGNTTIFPGQPWNGVPDAQPTSIKNKGLNSVVKKNAISFVGIRGGKIALNLTKGLYSAELYNLQGRLIGRTEINAVNGVNATNLTTNNLAKGMFILNVKQAGKMVLNNKIMVK